MSDFNRDWLVKQLQNNIIEVSFTKSNGEPRTLRCTLQETIIPKVTRQMESNAIRVYDISINQWRSFKPETVTNIKILLGVGYD